MQLNYAQKPFVPLSLNTYKSEFINQFCELNTGTRYLFAGYKEDKDSAQFVFITDNMGNVLGKRYLDINEGEAGLTYIHCNSDNTFSFFGWKKIYLDSTFRLFYCNIDSNLNIISKKDILVLGNKISLPATIYVSSTLKGDNIFTSILYKEIDSSTAPFYTYKLNSKWIKQNLIGDTILTYTPPSYLWFQNMLGNGAKANELIAHNSAYFIKIDTNFLFVDTMQLIQHNKGILATGRDTILYFKNMELLEIAPNIVLAGIQYMHIGPVRPAVGISRYNMNTKRLESINSFPFIPSPKIEDATLISSSHGLIYHNNAIYLTSGYIGPIIHLIIAKHDTSGKCAWIRYVDTDKALTFSGIFGCSDRGLIVLSSFKTTSNTIYPNADMLILKFNEEGFPLSTVNVSEQLRSGIVIYPNPAQEALHIKGAATNSIASIYNNFGQLIMQEIIRSSDHVLSIQQLPLGNYLYQINDKNGQKITSGNWIKR